MEKRTLKGAAILVHYRTPELVGPALQALQADAQEYGLEMDWILVDNSGEETNLQLWASLPLTVLRPGQNLGYAGGVNYGVERSRADWFVVMNPDVFVRPGCLSALLEQLQQGVDVAGPRFFWDPVGKWHLPPTERRRRLDELLAILARRNAIWSAWARRRWRQHARGHWLAENALESFELSGALLAIRRDSWNRTGPFDERYQLYFEETDWLERLRKARGRARFVPHAEAIHLHARSTLTEAKAEVWFQESARRFRALHYGRRFGRILESVDRWSRRRPPVQLERMGDGRIGEGVGWIEASAGQPGFPAAARPWTDASASFETILATLPEGSSFENVHLRSVSLAGRELRVWCANQQKL